MMEQEDWLFRPVLRGLIKGESLEDPAIDLAYIALLNEAIDVEIENTHRYRRSQERKK